MFFQWREFLKLVNFFLMSCKNNLSIVIWIHVRNINPQFSYSCYVMIDHHVIQIFNIFLLPLSSIASSGFHPSFTTDNVQKFEHKVKGKRLSVWSKECFLFLSQLFPEVGYMIVNWMCLCIWNISLLLLTCFYFWVLQLITQMFNVLVFSSNLVGRIFEETMRKYINFGNIMRKTAASLVMFE